jgi:hypothetical protein
MAAPVVNTRTQVNPLDPSSMTEGDDYIWGGNGNQQSTSSSFVDVTSTGETSTGTDGYTWSCAGGTYYGVGECRLSSEQNGYGVTAQLLHDATVIKTMTSASTSATTFNITEYGNTNSYDFALLDYGGTSTISAFSVGKVQIKGSGGRWANWIAFRFSLWNKTTLDTAASNKWLVQNGDVTRKWKFYLDTVSHVAHFGGACTMDGVTSNVRADNYVGLSPKVMVNEFTVSTPASTLLFLSGVFLEVS